MSTRNRLLLMGRSLIVLVSAGACASCMGFLDTDKIWHSPKYSVDRGIATGGGDRAKTAEKIRFEFENYYVEPKTPEGLKNYMMKFGDTCETRDVIVCTHRINYSDYIYTYFFDVYLGRRELMRSEYLVRITFPKEGDNVIPHIEIDVEINHINDP